MPKKEEVYQRAKEIIASDPTASKNRINQFLRAEYGVGLRSETVLRLKREVGEERPNLMPMLYSRGSVQGSLNDIYAGWIRAGFLPFEARELTVGHGERYRNFDARGIFDSETGKATRATRIAYVQRLRKAGWSDAQIRQNIIDFYLKRHEFDVWRHIREEYKPRKVMDFVDYKAKTRKRVSAQQRRYMRG